VGCLWDIHRRIRALFARLRLLACTSPMLQTNGASSSHFGLARSLMKRPTAQGNSVEAQVNLHLGSATKSSSSRSPAPLVALPHSALLQCIGKSLRETAESWEVLGETLRSACGDSHESRGALPHADTTSMAELLEALQGLSNYLVDRVCPLMEQLGQDPPTAISMPLQRGQLVGRNGSRLTEALSGNGSPGRPERFAENGCLNAYLATAVERLRQVPGSIGFEEASQTLALARRLTVDGARGKEELKQQGERLLVTTREKAALSDELQSLQDKHELLRSNLQVLEAAAAHRENGSATSQWGEGGGAVASKPAATTGAWGGVALSSRQRALLESVSVTAQESASLRQHGFFVDVISLTAAEATLASGPPSVEGSETWEEAVRKVYEQHCRSLQWQVQAADGRAVELQLAVQQSADLRREQEEVKQKLLGEVENKHAQLERVSEDIATTRRSYDAQLAMLTEHLCNLSVQISQKDESLASLQAQKILCGHCGMWNVMGKLLSKEGGGTCNTCKEKVLS